MANPGEPLSPRELDVLHELASGSSNKEIAQTLTISPNTVKVHVRRIFVKLEASSRTEAVTLAMQKGVLETPSPPQPEPAPPPANPVESESTATLESAETTPLPTRSVTETPVLSQPASTTFPTRFVLPLVAVSLLALAAIVAFVIRGPGAAADPAPWPEVALDEQGWFQVRPLPAARTATASASLGLNMYQIGGEVAGGVTDDVLVFNAQNQLWRTLNDKPTAVSHASAAVLAGQIHVIGGIDAAGNAVDTVEVYSPSADEWRLAPSFPEPVYGAAVVATSDALFVLGGGVNNTVSDTVYRFDPLDNNWELMPTLRQPRTNAAAAVVENVIYVVGGAADGVALDSCEQFDIAAEQWSECPSLNQPRSGARMTALFKRLYVVGGAEADVSVAEAYDLQQDSWQIINVPLYDDIDTWHNIGLALVETRIYLSGGEMDGRLTDAHYYFNPLPFQNFIPAATNP